MGFEANGVVLINAFEVPEGQDRSFPGVSGPATNP
jgi:hypothetical protein